MSELSRLFYQQGYSIDKEIIVGPEETRTWVSKDGLRYIIEHVPEISARLSSDYVQGQEDAFIAAGKICTQFIGAEPICRYDIMIGRAPDETPVHFMEWELVCPERRLRTIANPSDLSPRTIFNVEFLGEYHLSDFQS